MKVLFIRHAPAGDREKSSKAGRPDSQRPLTDAGRKAMKKAARGLARVAPEIGLIATSPLARARQTAAILAKSLDAPVREIPELMPERPPRRLIERLSSLRGRGALALVGHEPHLSAAVDQATTGGKGLKLQLKKGACCLVEFGDRPAPGRGTLLWALTPSQLRKLSR